MTRVVRSFTEPPLEGPVLLTIGTFDGVHRGHRFLLEQARERAAEHGFGLVIVTFDPSPAVVLRPGLRRYQLCTAEQKLRLLVALDPAAIFQLPFTAELSRWSASQFMDALEGRLDVRELWLGEDFHFGRDREGGLTMLIERARTSGFALHVVPRGLDDAAGISSTRIRQALTRGAVEEALSLLGYPYTLDLDSPVEQGPINGLVLSRYMVPESLAIPAPGAYAALWSAPNGEPRPVVCLVEDGAAVPVAVVQPADAFGPGEVEFIARLGESSGTDRLPALFARAAATIANWRRPVFAATGRL